MDNKNLFIYINQAGNKIKTSGLTITQNSTNSVLNLITIGYYDNVRVSFKLPDGTTSPIYHMIYDGEYELTLSDTEVALTENADKLNKYSITIPYAVTKTSFSGNSSRINFSVSCLNYDGNMYLKQVISANSSITINASTTSDSLDDSYSVNDVENLWSTVGGLYNVIKEGVDPEDFGNLSTRVSNIETGVTKVYANWDGNNNIITNTYETKTDAASKLNESKSYTDLIAATKENKLTFDTVPTQASRNPVESGGVYTAIESVAAVASGKTKSYVVNTSSAPSFNSQNASISISGSFVDNSGVTVNVSDLKIGDNIFVVQTDVPDRWVSSISGSNATLLKLETSLSNYYTKSEINTTLGNYALNANLSNVATSGEYSDLINTPTNITQFSSGNARQGQVLTADGNGGSTWENTSAGDSVYDFGTFDFVLSSGSTISKTITEAEYNEIINLSSPVRAKFIYPFDSEVESASMTGDIVVAQTSGGISGFDVYFTLTRTNITDNGADQTEFFEVYCFPNLGLYELKADHYTRAVVDSITQNSLSPVTSGAVYREIGNLNSILTTLNSGTGV